MKKMMAVAVAAASLAGCSKPADQAAAARMPEFYMYEGKDYCLAELANAEPDAVKRRDTTFELLTQFYAMTRGGRERFNIVGVDYVDFKKMTLVVYTPCTDKAAIDGVLAEAGSVNKMFSGKQGGDKDLVSDAKVVDDNPGGIRRFTHFNPGVSAEVCLMHYTMPGAGQNAGRIASAVVNTAVEFHFPIADFATNGENMFFLLARDCDKQDKIAEGMAAALKRRGIEVNSLIVRDKATLFAEYQTLQPASNEPEKK